MADTYPSMAPTRDGRLACACNCAYGIGTRDGRYRPPAIYDAGVGWLDIPKPVSAPRTGDTIGPRINAALVGRNVDGIVVAMRGTLPPAWTVASLEDWWQDIVDSEPVAAPPLPGRVHSGFRDALETLWRELLAVIRALISAHPGDAVWVTGHSKGGPLASVGAARLVLEAGLSVDGVVTFASPHPGDAAFAAGYPVAVPVHRYENCLDLVPFLPPTDTFYKVFDELLPESWQQEFCNWFPSLCWALEQAAHWNYTPLGALSYVTCDHDVVGPDDWRADAYLRVGQIVATLFGVDAGESLEKAINTEIRPTLSESGLDRIGAAHCIACPGEGCAGGYMSGAGGDPVCPAGG